MLPLRLWPGEEAVSQFLARRPAFLWCLKASAVDSAGNLYISAGGIDVVYKVTPVAVASLSSLALSTTGRLFRRWICGHRRPTELSPRIVAFDPAGNLYIADLLNGRIRKVSSNGIISTVAGGARYGRR